MKKIYLIIALILLCATSNAQTTIIAQNSSWKYLDNGSNQGTAWSATSFSDTSWASGNAELGYGDGGEATVLSYGTSATSRPVTSYFRKTFSVANPSLYSNFTLSLLRDDGAVVYLNGVEVARSNMPTGTIGYSTLASSEITGTNETAYTTYAINPSRFVVGNNVLAIEVHQATTNNVDLSFNLKLTATTSFCGTPISLNATAIAATTATLNWSAVPSILNYSIQYRKIGTTTWTTTTSTTNSKALTGLTHSSAYEFQVKANCLLAGGYSAPATFTTVTPTCSIPISLTTANVTTTTATLSWAAVIGATSYNIQYRKTGVTTWTTTTATTASKALTALTAGTGYDFQVQAVCLINSAYSSLGNFTTLAYSCGTPTALTSSAVANTTATLSWTAVSGATSYNIQYRKTGVTTWTTTTATIASKAIASLSVATVYEFQVQAVCAITSPYSAMATFTTTSSCGTPSALNTSTVTASSATLSWQAVSGAISYNIQYRIIGATSWTVTTAATTTKSLTNLVAGTSYQFQIQTMCLLNVPSVYSTMASFTTLTNCGSPSSLSTSAITDSSAMLSWLAVSGANSYNIQYRPTGTTTWSTITASTTTINITNLLATTNYEFQVQALCGTASAYSQSANFSTLEPIPTCATPTGLSTANITATGVTLSWQEVVGVGGYNIQYRIIGSNIWNTTYASINTKTLTGLLETNTYEVQVQAICTISNIFSAAVYFTTLTSGTSFVIPANSSWKYLDNGTNQETVWNTNSFDDSSWANANAEFGYGDGDETTIVNYGTDALNKYVTTYFRKTFTLSNPSVYSSILFELIRDDGAVVYLNGIEVYRNNMPAGAISYNTLATTAASGTDEKFWYPVALNPAQILSGNNVIAVEIHQQYYDSSDLSFNGRLSATIPGTCGTPASLTTANVGSSSATLNWQAINGAASYNIQYRIVGTETWSTASATTNTKSITSLTPNSNYEFQVQAVCGFMGTYSGTGFFTTTQLTCNAPSAIVISSVTTTTATITWQAATDATSYNIQYRPNGTTTWLTATTAISSIQLTNLVLSTSYEFQIQSVCSFPSSFSPLTYFATPASTCIAPTGLSIASIVSSTVTLSWQSAEGATGYVVEYQLAGTNAWASYNTTSTSKTITGLIAATGYEFRVKSICSATSGNYSAVLGFTTYPAGANYFVAPSSTWKYSDTGINQNTAWREVSFNDATWKTGTAEFGYGDGDETTIVSYGPDAANKYPTTYFRKTFTIENPANYSALSLGIVRDDGAVAYLNGIEIFRSNLPTGVIGYNTYAIESLGGSDETDWVTTAVDAALLVAGTNVLSVEIHQNSLASSDLSFNGRLTAASNIVAPVVTRGAYLQKLSSNSITIRWRTDIPSNTVVQYGTSIAYGNTASDNNLVTEHIITLPALTSNTKYFYSIGTSTETLQGDLKNNFITAPTTGSSAPVRIWAIGDFGNGTNQQLNVRNAYNAYTGTTPTNVWLWLGDNAYTSGSDSEFQDRVFNQYTNEFKNMAVFPTPGNHDYNESGYQQPTTLGTNYPYFSIFSLPENGECGGVPSASPKYYSFNYANVHFISIDSYGTLNAPGSPLYTWLTNDLAANTQRWTVVFMHYPPYTYGTHNSDTETTLIDMRKIITPLLESYHVDLVLAGHSHVNERSYMIKGHYDIAPTFTEAMKVSTQTNNFVKSPPYNGTVYAVCGTSGQNPEVVNQPGYPMPAMYFNNNTNNCSLVIDVNGDLLSCKYLTSTGSIADDFTITKTNTVARDAIIGLDQGKDALNAVVNQNTITLDYTLTEDAELTAELINILGERVMEIQIPTSQTKGDYNYEVPTKGAIAEGLYFIRMSINGKPLVKKVYVVK